MDKFIDLFTLLCYTYYIRLQGGIILCIKNFSDLNNMGLEYENIHSHSYYSNIMTHDSVISRTDIAKRAVELGHQTFK